MEDSGDVWETESRYTDEVEYDNDMTNWWLGDNEEGVMMTSKV